MRSLLSRSLLSRSLLSMSLLSRSLLSRSRSLLSMSRSLLSLLSRRSTTEEEVDGRRRSEVVGLVVITCPDDTRGILVDGLVSPLLGVLQYQGIPVSQELVHSLLCCLHAHLPHLLVRHFFLRSLDSPAGLLDGLDREGPGRLVERFHSARSAADPCEMHHFVHLAFLSRLCVLLGGLERLVLHSMFHEEVGELLLFVHFLHLPRLGALLLRGLLVGFPRLTGALAEVSLAFLLLIQLFLELKEVGLEHPQTLGRGRGRLARHLEQMHQLGFVQRHQVFTLICIGRLHSGHADHEGQGHSDERELHTGGIGLGGFPL